MFSGGRDSTLAALRLNEAGQRLVLVTVTSGHLVGLDRVRRRLGEVARRLPPDTPWVRVRQPEELGTDTSFYDQTCLPCHHAYVVVSAVIARALGASRLAFGYAGYQSDWPEQTPLAVSRLAALLERHGIELVLPVYDLHSRDEAVAELTTRGFGSDSLEQKCLRQVFNVALDEARLAQQVELWEKAIETSMTVSPPVDAEVLELTTVAHAQIDPAETEQQPHGTR
jgi:hypothetical protein